MANERTLHPPLVAVGTCAWVWAAVSYAAALKPNGGWRKMLRARSETAQEQERDRWACMTTFERTSFYLVPALVVLGGTSMGAAWLVGAGS